MSTSTVHELIAPRRPRRVSKPATTEGKITAIGIALMLAIGLLFWTLATR